MEIRNLVIVATALFLSQSVTFGEDSKKPPTTKPPSARRAELVFRRAVSAANAEYQLRIRQAEDVLRQELQAALDAATKDGDLDGALEIRQRIDELKAPPRGKTAKNAPVAKLPTPPVTALQRTLGSEVAGLVWAGSPTWGKFVLNSDGSMTIGNRALSNPTSRWTPVGDHAVIINDNTGAVTVMLFDPARDSVTAYWYGRLPKPSWEANRVPAPK